MYSPNPWRNRLLSSRLLSEQIRISEARFGSHLRALAEAGLAVHNHVSHVVR